jgi:hypothetical protein
MLNGRRNLITRNFHEFTCISLCKCKPDVAKIGTVMFCPSGDLHHAKSASEAFRIA